MNGIRQMSPVTLRISWVVIFMDREEVEDGGSGEEQRKDGEEGRMVKELKRCQRIWLEKEWMKRRTRIAESLWGEATDWLTEESRFDFREERRFLSSA